MARDSANAEQMAVKLASAYTFEANVQDLFESGESFGVFALAPGVRGLSEPRFGA